MRIVLYCPVREKPEVLTLTLQSHRKLRGVEERWYFDDNVSDESSALLKNRHVLGVRDPEGGYQDHAWTSSQMDRMARIRDFGIATFLETDYDALLIVDADVILPPDLANHLAETLLHNNSPIVSEVYWSKWPNSDVWMPNVWDVQSYRFDSPESILRLREPGVYKVGGLGAVTLISRAALEAGARYATIPHLGYVGEDRSFSVRAAALGLTLLADTSCTPFHVYRPNQLDEAKVWFESGCPREYFSTWLNDEWERGVKQLAPLAVAPKRQVIALCTPGEHFSALWVWHYVELWNAAMRAGFACLPFQGYCTNPYVTRMNMARDVLASPHRIDYVLWIDDDNLVSWPVVQKLMDDLQSHPEASSVAAWCWMQPELGDGTALPNVAHWVDYHCEALQPEELSGEELIETEDFTRPLVHGFPCVLMRRELLEALTPSAFMPKPEDCEAAIDSGREMPGEDVAFCLAAHRRGFRLLVDPSLQIPHLKLRMVVPKVLHGPKTGNLEERMTQA